MNEFNVVIPSRLDSKRLPRKALAVINGKPLIEWVHQRAIESAAKIVLIATDSEEIASVAKAFGAKVEMTSTDHHSGTDRIFEVCERRNWNDEEIVVNLQGDNPLMPCENSNQIAQIEIFQIAQSIIWIALVFFILIYLITQKHFKETCS